MFWIALALAVVVIYSYMNSFSGDQAEVTYSEFMAEVESGNVAEVTFKDREVQGSLREPKAFESIQRGQTVTKFKTRIPFPDYNYGLVDRLQKQNVKIIAKTESPLLGYLLAAAPWLLIVLVWLFFIRQMQGASGPRGLFSFGKSKAKLLTDERPKVTFKDVAGVVEAKEELSEIIDFLREPGKFQRLGGKIPKGALLLGPPGTGKTLLARAIAGEAGVPFFSMSGSDFVEMFVGVGASRVRDLFEQGKKNAPCIIFIDEIDAVGRHRGAGLGGGHDEREQTLNQLLVEMDGFESNEGVILIAATNRPDVLDPALLRPGRFDRQIVVPNPDVKGREGILRVHARKVKLSEEVDFEVLARGTPGMSGADLANVVNEAALLASRKNRDAVTMEDFEEAKDKVLMGSARRSLVISDEEKKVIAYHESGHTLVAKYLPKADPIHKVTIVPRGMALGVTQSLPVDERHTHSKEYLESTLAVLMGGRVAEMIVFNQLDTGAGNDLERATKLARRMVCNWGMSERVGPVTFGRTEDHIFLGREMAQTKDYSEATAELIDQEVRRFIETAEEIARGILTAHIDKLHALSHRLLEKEAVDSREVDEIIGRAPSAAAEVESPTPTPER
ncbi:MAG TPA: ATP-dependent zinc metalloprotease FtsH [candidate division Zixibacteria bacterium]|nr:ATP-dependent zinc metalloprotease FtsH [candidate division Zixibacteria bacterium]MDD4916430.1 ATP-dependent zinc metalloprotease FtsH [candidate division Zixibacteria bacterium]MDM7972569.1 ATP-dependent zinc metalloprotease FtsH [candidate division Zixibacteria bacterium]HOZ07799.1 ATP-dependent zinc metalloprotease FtsH [candidate division Zixibacteria bacterium]HPI33227.1 ATP-dependent zinc metalloprotease FtsH [candidate division Zixibacteria bacterium]